ncbi:MAG: AMP-binding protein [Thermodesulfobacteriota bacterium]
MIKARIAAEAPESANLTDYDQTRDDFSWADMQRRFSWHGTDEMNIIAESIDHWAESEGKCDHNALVFEAHGCCQSYTYAQLRARSSQWAAMLEKYGFAAGDRLMVFLPPCPETFLAMAACARIGVIFCPVFASSNFYEIELRLQRIAPRAVLTHPDLVEKIPLEASGRLDYIFLTQGPEPGLFVNEVNIAQIPDQMPADTICRRFSGDTPLYLIFTSGSTRPPKGIIHTHADMVGIYASAHWALDIKPDSILWTDADPAWVTGTVYGAFGPWLCGVTSLVTGDVFSAANWYRTLEKHRVSAWYTTPRILRDIMDAGADLPTRYKLSALAHIITVGAPLVPDILYWCRKHLHCTPHETWWMTETGIICIANLPGIDIKPGAMGKPLPGIEAAVVDENGEPMPQLSLGELALKIPWPGLMTGIWEDEARYERYFLNDQWFLTGDMSVEDEEGYFYHQGRNDDLLKAGGDKVIGPFEIEQVLTMHPAVAEAAVISKGLGPGEGVSYLKAFVTTAKGYTPSSRLNYEIRAFLRGNLSSDVVVNELAFIEELPKTRSGKLLRRILRAWELGLPGGDTDKMQD